MLYLYPEHFTDELMDVLSGDNKILPYLDIPLQHINDTMLRRMQRRVNRAQTEELLDRLAAADSRLGAADDVDHWISRRDGRTIW